ncbi:MAG TPA: ribonuclease P protein component [Chromatiaceae bacterium]|nr:ribonuclease P protein component [Chromatiaceae bacterium]
MGFPRSARLTAASDYQYVFADPRKAVDRNFVVLYRPGRESAARLGLAVTKKRLRRAVDRNRIKRLTRESFRHAREHLGSVDAVVLVRDGCASRGNAELRASLDRLWQKVASRHS